MRLAVCVILIAAFGFTTSARAGEPTYVEANLYYRALVAALAEMEHEHSITGTAVTGRRVIVVSDAWLTSGFPSRIRGFDVEYLPEPAVRAKIGALSEETPLLLAVSPILSAESRLTVRVTVLSLSSARPDAAFGDEGAYEVPVVFDCTRGAFEIGHVTSWSH